MSTCVVALTGTVITVAGADTGVLPEWGGRDTSTRLRRHKKEEQVLSSCLEHNNEVEEEEEEEYPPPMRLYSVTGE